MTKEKLLVIDDDKNMARLLEVVLEEDFEINVAHSIEEALNFFTKNKYSAILLDLNLNGQDGFSVVSSIRTSNKWLPIVVVSGKEKSDERIKCFKAGVDDYMTKPFNPEELKLRLSRNISRFKLIDSL